MTEPQTRRALRAYVAIAASVLALAVGSFIYSNYAAERSAQKWCAVIGTLDAAYRSQPPTTPTGQLLAARIAHLYRSLGC